MSHATDSGKGKGKMLVKERVREAERLYMYLLQKRFKERGLLELNQTHLS